MDKLRGATAIVGAFDTEVGKRPDATSTHLCLEAVKGAVEDAGMKISDVEGLITCNSQVTPVTYHAELIAEALGIEPRMCLSVSTGGGTTVATVAHAAASISTGMCKNVVIVKGDNLATGFTKDQALASMASVGHPQFEQPYGAPVPAFYALVAQAHMHAYGTTSEQMARVAVSAHYHASLHPGAHKREVLTVDDVLSSKMIADPLHLYDCSLVSDGGAALVMTSADAAKDRPKKPIYLLGFGEGHRNEHISQARSFTESGAVESGESAFKMSKMTPEDVDVASLYDCFTPVVLIELEDLGFCPKGESGQFVEDGSIDLGGKIPVNTHGGLLSHCHPGNPGSMFHVTELVKQLRNECGERQVKGASVGLAHLQGGILSSHGTLLLGGEETI